ncbi:MAG: hypothetical protein SVR94_01210 [Pseudomonadota bacterium]|nr:hypothetical protein [Pseudomonadota bacterium]
MPKILFAFIFIYLSTHLVHAQPILLDEQLIDPLSISMGNDPSLAKCTDLKYCKKGSRFGKEYISYIVKCSNGKKRKITAWDNRKKWCIGMSYKCYSSQMKAAAAACK